MALKIGAKVGSRRWPYAGAHPDCWGKPWQGTLISVLDPRAWAGRLAFPVGTPKAEGVAAHCACHSIDDNGDQVPVLWDFGTSGKQVQWERRAALKPYAEDLADWTSERWASWLAKGAA